jgi:hypothetical protein
MSRVLEEILHAKNRIDVERLQLINETLAQHNATIIKLTQSLLSLLERVDQLSVRLETVERSQTHVLHALVDPVPDPTAQSLPPPPPAGKP